MNEQQLDLTFRTRRALGGVGILTAEDMEETGEGVERVRDLMLGGGWHTRSEIELAAGRDGKPAAEGMRRMRELRRWYRIEKQRLEGRHWVYRIAGEK